MEKKSLIYIHTVHSQCFSSHFLLVNAENIKGKLSLCLLIIQFEYMHI